jgi:hypothetical protein
LYVGLRNPKNHLKPLKTQNNIFMLARSSQQAIATPSPGHNCAQAEPPGQALTRARQPSLLLAEPSPGHTSFLQQHDFQDNIQYICRLKFGYVPQICLLLYVPNKACTIICATNIEFVLTREES